MEQREWESGGVDVEKEEQKPLGSRSGRNWKSVWSGRDRFLLTQLSWWDFNGVNKTKQNKCSPAEQNKQTVNKGPMQGSQGGERNQVKKTT